MAYLNLLWYLAIILFHVDNFTVNPKGLNYSILRRVISEKCAPSMEQEKSKCYLKWASRKDRELPSCNTLTWSWKLNHAPSCAGRQEAPRGPPTEPGENYCQVPCLVVRVTPHVGIRYTSQHKSVLYLRSTPICPFLCPVSSYKLDSLALQRPQK